MGSVADPAWAAAAAPTFRLTHKANLGVARTASAGAAAAAADDDEAATVAIPAAKAPSKAKAFSGVLTLQVPFKLAVDADGAAKLSWQLPGGTTTHTQCAVDVDDKRLAVRKSKGRAPTLTLPTELDGVVSGDTVKGTAEGNTFEMKLD